MHSFLSYLQPLTLWLHNHPHWALFISFLVSFLESLAIIGSLVPGSVTMTAIGILAGSGVMRIDLTMSAAILGAVAGDGLSYALGLIFKHRLSQIWPFSRHPIWLAYGKDFFAKNGSKSVIIGRFVGPLRSVIPLIAGMMHMNQWHFFLANFISAIGWSLLYVMPGVLIGTASSDLSAESASHLFFILLIIIATIWLASVFIKWLYQHANLFLRQHFHRAWQWFENRPYLGAYVKKITPINEQNHSFTMATFLASFLVFFIALSCTYFALNETRAIEINHAVSLFVQSIRTRSFDIFFIIVSLILQPLCLIAFFLSLLCGAIYQQNWRFLSCLASLCASCAGVITCLAALTKIQSFPAFEQQNIILLMNFTFASTVLNFFIFYLHSHHQNLSVRIIRILFHLLLFLTGISSIYLGEVGLTNIVAAYFIGLTLCLLHWMVFRLAISSNNSSQLFIFFSMSILFVASYMTYRHEFTKAYRTYHSEVIQYSLTDKIWWCQHQPLLPLYTTNHLGQHMSILNIQYAGDIALFQQALKTYGWEKKSASFFYALLMRAGGQASDTIPLLAQLYLNKKPHLIMTYRNNPTEPLMILRMWRSNYHLYNFPQPIWLGSVQFMQKDRTGAPCQKSLSSFKHLVPALAGFQFNFKTLLNVNFQQLHQDISPTLLFIKEPNAYVDPCY